MPVRHILVNMSARLVWVKDTNSVRCSLCPKRTFRTLYAALIHSLKHRGRCSNSYPIKNNDNMVDCCPKIVTHEDCLDLAIYGAVSLIRWEIVDNKIELRVKCNFKQENPQNRAQPLNKPCNQEFDNIRSYNDHVGLTHCQHLRTVTSGYVQIGTIILELEKDVNYDQTIIYNFESNPWIKQPNLLYSKPRTNELKLQLQLSNLVSQKTLQNDVFISIVVGFDLKLLDKKVEQWEEANPEKQVHLRMVSKFVKELLPPVETVE